MRKSYNMPNTKARTNGRTHKRRLPKRIEVGKYLVSDPEVYHGELTFKGTRIPVKTVLTFLGMGDNLNDLLEGYPRLNREAIKEAIELAKQTFVTPFELGNGRDKRGSRESNHHR
jgi:uncharacterized protein (DUF433 family)